MKLLTLKKTINTIFKNRLNKVSKFEQEQSDTLSYKPYIIEALQLIGEIDDGVNEQGWRSLFRAAIENNDLTIARLIIKAFLPSQNTLEISIKNYEVLKSSGTLLHLAAVSSPWFMNEILDTMEDNFFYRLLTKHTNAQGGALSELHLAVQYQSTSTVKHLLRRVQDVFSTYRLHEYILLKTPVKGRTVLHISSDYSPELFELFHQFGVFTFTSKQMQSWLEQASVYNVQDEHVMSHFHINQEKNDFLDLYLSMLDRNKFKITDIIKNKEKQKQVDDLLPEIALCL